MKTNQKQTNNLPFKRVVNNVESAQDSAELNELNQQIAELQAQASAQMERQERKRKEALEKEKAEDLDTLASLKIEIAELNDAAQLSGKLSLEDARQLSKQRSSIQLIIDEIEQKYGLNPQPKTDITEAVAEPKPTVWPTVSKIVAILAACYGIVLYSGDWILDKYPTAAIYNDVSFQKVLFGFAVFTTGLISVIVSLTVFFPGIGKYFNPFNQYDLDFFNDFKKLSSWQRNVIAIALFACLLFAFVLTVSGKLD